MIRDWWTVKDSSKGLRIIYQYFYSNKSILDPCLAYTFEPQPHF
jgi:hypothetical protein